MFFAPHKHKSFSNVCYEFWFLTVVWTSIKSLELIFIQCLYGWLDEKRTLSIEIVEEKKVNIKIFKIVYKKLTGNASERS